MELRKAVTPLVLVLLSLALALSTPARATDDEDDEDEIQFTYEEKLEACAACHGPNGNEPLAPSYPRIAGQHADYLEHALKSYRSGRRQNAIMQSQAQMLNLTDSDIRRLAEHFSGLPGLTQVPTD